MEMIIDFPSGSKVDAHFGEFTVKTDQPVTDGGGGSAPTPFNLFLAAIGTCAGIYVLGFCKQRGLSTADIRIIERIKRSQVSGMVEDIELEIQVPHEFPKRYYEALVHSAELCAVKKHLENPPKFKVFATVAS